MEFGYNYQDNGFWGLMIMYFDLSAFIRYNFRAFFKARGEQYRLTPKRFLVLFIWLILYIPAQVFNRICFLLDEILFPNYRQQEVRQPIFIIGNPRSGTTFLHRLLYKDTESFTAFSVWELIFAPSILQRKMIWALAKLGRLIGDPVRRIVRSINKRLNRSQRNSAHVIKINEAEEDEHILIHSWTSESLWAIYPFQDELLPYFFFDRDIPPAKQRKVMGFYKNMIQRHLYAHGGDKILLSKNPSHSSKLSALTETFPDARFINLVRTPFEAVPSMLDYMSAGWNFFCDPLETYPFKDELVEVMKYYYLYPAEFFKDKDKRCNFIEYEDFVQHPDEIIEDLYAWLKLDYSEAFKELDARETQAARRYKSGHKYSSTKMGLSEERIAREFEEVFSYYEFDNHQFDLKEHPYYWKVDEWPKVWKLQRKRRQQKLKLKKLEKNQNLSS
jgi:hypothetical protein